MRKLFLIILFFAIASAAFSQNQKRTYSTYITDTMYLADSTLLCWETHRESDTLPIYVEQFLWGRWRPVGKVMGKGSPDFNSYSYPVVFISGLNNFRIAQYDWTERPSISPILKFTCNAPPVTYEIKTDTIVFSRKTVYQICAGEEILTSGISSQIDISELPKGKYILQYDSKSELIEINK